MIDHGGHFYMKDLLPARVTISLVFHQKRPMVMHTAKQEKCQILWMCPFHGLSPPRIRKFFEFSCGVRNKSCGMYPPPRIWHLVEIFEILLLHVLSNDACKFAINHFPITWGPFENVNLLYFLLKMQIWISCNVLNIAGNPIKDISVNLSFLSSGSKVVEWPPRIGKFFAFISGVRNKSCRMYPPPRIWHLVEIFEILLLHVLSNKASKFAINHFPITWGPFENVNLLYFLLKMQIWNGYNAFHIAGNPIKDINVNLSFLSSGSIVVEWAPPNLEKIWVHFWGQDQKLQCSYDYCGISFLFAALLSLQVALDLHHLTLLLSGTCGRPSSPKGGSEWSP